MKWLPLRQVPARIQLSLRNEPGRNRGEGATAAPGCWQSPRREVRTQNLAGAFVFRE